MNIALQKTLPYDPVNGERALPGVAPLALEDWILADEAYGGQMARKLELLAEKRDKVIALSPQAYEAAQELLETALGAMPSAFAQEGDTVMCPDGRRVAIDGADPLATLAQLFQQDMCILQKEGDEHVLTGAALCFPASWSLSQKFMRPMLRIHKPVDSYDDGIARRVQRLFDGVQPDRPLWRFNALWYVDAELHQPRLEGENRPRPEQGLAPYLRSERQVILRLPKTRAVVFSIHTYILERADVADVAGA